MILYVETLAVAVRDSNINRKQFKKSTKHFPNKIMEQFLTINLVLENDNNEQLSLKVPSIALYIKTDLYYYSLDNSIANYSYSHKIHVVLTTLLKKWQAKIEKLPTGMSCFLPFDFSDQYIGCLKLTANPNNIIVGNYGFTQKIMGMMINPSDMEQFEIEELDFESDSALFSVSKKELIESIEVSINNL